MWRLTLVLFISLILLATLVGCGGSSTSNQATTSTGGGGGGGTPGGGTGGGGTGGGGGTSGGATSGDFYVATDGNDNWSGTFAAPQGNPPTDGPFATVDRAQIAVQGIAKTRGTPIVVLVRNGVYYQTALSFTSADSGASSTPVVYENYLNETPVLSGGIQVQNWTNVSGNQWAATLPASTVNFEALYYNGVRRMRPRLGSGTLGTYYRVSAQITGCGTSNGVCYDRFYYNPSDPISNTWQNLSPQPGNPCNAPANAYPGGDIELVVFEWWSASRERISCVDTTNHIIYLTGNTLEDGFHGYIPTHRYIVENMKDQLSQPGQWFLDRSNPPWTLTYLANAGENPNTDTVMIPQSAQVLTATGLQWVTFSGITFTGDNFLPASTGYPGDQGDREVPAGINCNDCSNVTFDNDTFTNITGNALGLPTDNKGTATNNLVQNSAFYDLGAGGMIMGHYQNGNETDANVLQFTTIQNNIVQGFGRVYPSTAGIQVLGGHDLLLTHNEVNDGYNVGINVCIPTPTFQCGLYNGAHGTFNVTLSYNDIWNMGQGILNDFGGIYQITYTATGNSILNNRIHDSSDASSQDADGYGGHGLYLDQGTADVDVENNLIYRASATLYNMTWGPQVAGVPNTFKNNIGAYGRQSVVGASACPPSEPLLQFNFTNNIVYQDRTSISSPPSTIQKGGDRYFGTGDPTLAQNWADNMYFNSTEDFSTDPNMFFVEPSADCTGSVSYSFSGWQGFGEDKGSVVQNPGFPNPGCNQTTAAACVADPTQDNYSLAASPGVGFVIFDTAGTCSTCPGRTSTSIVPPAQTPGFPIQPYSPATDF